MKFFKKIFIAITLLTLVIGCAQVVDNEGSSRVVSIDISSITRAFSTDTNVYSVNATATDTASGVEIDSVSLYQSGTSWTGSFNIFPADEGTITFAANAMDMAGTTIYIGSTEVNVPETTSVTIPMYSATGTITGTVQSATDAYYYGDGMYYIGSTIDIDIYDSQGTYIDTTQTLADGSFSIELPASTDYELYFNEYSYGYYFTSIYYNANVTQGNTTSLGYVNMISTSYMYYNVDTYLYIYDNMATYMMFFADTINIRQGINNRTGTIYSSYLNTDYAYAYLPVGNYTVEVISAPYNTKYYQLDVHGSDYTQYAEIFMQE